jgi:hypothetical protein
MTKERVRKEQVYFFERMNKRGQGKLTDGKDSPLSRSEEISSNVLVLDLVIVRKSCLSRSAHPHGNLYR